ncbi:MAG: hypothetical protein PVF04_05845, partial [Anaerolineae bacterium]
VSVGVSAEVGVGAITLSVSVGWGEGGTVGSGVPVSVGARGERVVVDMVASGRALRSPSAESLGSGDT